MTLESTCLEAIKLDEKKTTKKWRRGGCSGRVLVGVAYGDIEEVGTSDNLNFIAHASAHYAQLARACLVMREALVFYAGEWGPHQGFKSDVLNEYCMDKLNESRSFAQDALVKVDAICAGKDGEK